MIDYKILMDLGFKKHTAQNIIREAKIKLINKGYNLYENKRCGVVPIFIVEDIIGMNIRKEVYSEN